ncbi:MAG: metal-dependent transcriptional regulator [Ignavibacteriaceae bacterium]|nr:metal-dependent transcriptional regulator [Ignavibacteriaceae bacterium]HRN25998.1 metal-dependent transcriptional regulator [Ignavibacteriaceae bacterium]HRP91358.1 metal-dependent transcriptional regulator [Ignavibacteriaceae bacterium]HRQ53618.1 metal-dependent transcriptional regulator [Ignavibacteriaceae bacterium]
MNEPLMLLTIGIFTIVIFVLLFYPNKGIIYIWKKSRYANKKILIEDALKYLYNCEYNNVNCTLNGVAGNLSISADDATDIISRLESMGLVSAIKDELSLTSDGRSYALRIVRVHRLWEKYLADETSVTENEWHQKAEQIEHILTPEQADLLAAQIGNPVFDPHGDPIPSASGELPQKKGKLLTEMKINEFANIIHVEDEPHAIYSQILAEGLYPGMQIRMMEISDKRVKFIANGEECILSPLIAKNITVGVIKLEKQIDGKFKPLSSLKIGEKGTILGIGKALRGQQRRRLMDLGIVPGTKIEAELQSLTGDPVAYKVRGTTVALRKQQTDKIFLVNDEVK